MDPVLSTLEQGTRVAMVAIIEASDSAGIWKCEGLSPVQSFLTKGHGSLDDGIYTFYDLLLSDTTQCFPICEIDDLTRYYKKSNLDFDKPVKVFDLCAGIGGFSMGTKPVGFETVLLWDHNPLACQLLRQNFDVPVVEGSVADMRLIKSAHGFRDDSILQITGGFPCQPYSNQGDQCGLGDTRSQVLFDLLRMAWLLQAEMILMECVASILRFPPAISVLEEFAKLHNMQIQHFTLNLKQQWPTNRDRFWCVMTTGCLPQISIPPWDLGTPFQCLGDVMPFDALWPMHDEDDLCWDDLEMYLYLNPNFGNDKRILSPTDTLPTALHSWGNVGRACPCECRSMPFSIDRLRQGGARGFGLTAASTGKPRHFHPEEALLLHTVPLTYSLQVPVRAGLCMIGQLAAPLQVLWIQSHIAAQLELSHRGLTSINPRENIRGFQQYLLSQCQERWITKSMHIPRSLTLTDESDIAWSVQVKSPVTAGQIRLAEQQMSSAGLKLQIETSRGPLPDHSFMHSGIKYILNPLIQDSDAGSPDEIFNDLGDQTLWQVQTWMLDLAIRSEETCRPLILHPVQASKCLNNQVPDDFYEQCIHHFDSGSGDIMFIIAIMEHWTFLHGQMIDGRMHWTWTDGLHDSLRPLRKQSAQLVTHRLTHQLRIATSTFFEAPAFSQQYGGTCGTLALLNFGIALGFEMSWTQAQLFQLHRLLQDDQPPGSTIFAGGPQWHEALTTLIASKGVPAASAPDRARQLGAKLGGTLIQQILAAKNPWSALKAAASKPGVMFRIITAEEQEQYVAERAKTKHGAAIHKPKSKKAQGAHQGPRPLQLLPEDFTVAAEHFLDAHKKPVPQIPFDQVGSGQRGVALCNPAQAQRFLENPKSLSLEGLALLFLEAPPQDTINSAGLQRIRFPALCKTTGEHTIIFGHILQLGDQPVTREFTGPVSKPDVIDTKVVKFQAFKDEYTADWNLFIGAPVKHLIQMIDILQLCKGVNCGSDCSRFHPGVDETMDSAVFEVWSRTYLSADGTKVENHKASLFTVFLRVPAAALNTILISTPPGIYAEPRTEEKEADKDFSVIWLPGLSAQDALHKCKTCTKAICLVRMRQKYGVRVKKSDEETAWAALRPDTTFQAVSVQQIFEIFPLPHGTQRQAVQKALNDWKWSAKALQPGRGSTSHMAWRVGAESTPPQPIMNAFDMEVVIKPVKDLKPTPFTPTIIASAKTQKHLRNPTSGSASSSGAQGSSDPWWRGQQDPWGNYTNRPQGQESQPAAHRSHLDEIKETLVTDVKTAIRKELEQQVLDTAGDATMDEASSARIAELESGMTEIRAQQDKLFTWMGEAGSKMKQHEHMIGEVQKSVNQQQKEMSQLGSSFANSIKTIKTEIQADMTSNFDTQFSRLEALLEKRIKTG